MRFVPKAVHVITRDFGVQSSSVQLSGVQSSMFYCGVLYRRGTFSAFTRLLVRIGGMIAQRQKTGWAKKTNLTSVSFATDRAA